MSSEYRKKLSQFGDLKCSIAKSEVYYVAYFVQSSKN